MKTLFILFGGIVKKAFFTTFIMILFSYANASLIADYDKACDYMFCHEANIDPTIHKEQENYFLKKIPKIIHQIWFGDPSRLNKKFVEDWKNYAERFGYKYFLWTEEHDEYLQTFMKKENYNLMLHLRKKREYAPASDVLRFELLKKFGGVYVDCDFVPPRNKNGFVDFEQIVPLQGLILFTEHLPRNVGTDSAIFVMTGIMISSPEHPLLCSLVEQVYKNAMHWNKKNKDYNGTYATGPVFLNKVLSGSFHVLPAKILKTYRME
jgi:mannosyltransferase OCH1-like enzyme